MLDLQGEVLEVLHVIMFKLHLLYGAVMVFACDLVLTPSSRFTNVFEYIPNDYRASFVLCLANSTATASFSLNSTLFNSLERSFRVTNLTIQYFLHRSLCVPGNCIQQTLWILEIFLFNWKSLDWEDRAFLTFANVRMSGQRLVWPDCEAEWCSHCLTPPFVWPGQTSTVIERHPVSQVPPTFNERCHSLQDFIDYAASVEWVPVSFFTITSASMTIIDSHLDNIRIRAFNFICLSGSALLTISNTTVTRMDFTNSFIGYERYVAEPVTVLLQRLTVSGLNRDHAYVRGYNSYEDTPLFDAGFLSLKDVVNLTLVECVFEDNLQLQEQEYIPSTVFVAGVFFSITLQSCVFRRSMHRLMFYWTSITKQTDAFPVQIRIVNCTFENDLALFLPYLFIGSTEKPIDLVLADCSFVNITATNPTLFLLYLADGEVVINNTHFSNCSAYSPANSPSSALTQYVVMGIRKCTMRNTSFVDNYVQSPRAPSLVTQLLAASMINDSEDLRADFLVIPPQTCTALLALGDWITLSLIDVTITANPDCDITIFATPSLSVQSLSFSALRLTIRDVVQNGLIIEGPARSSVSSVIESSAFLNVSNMAIKMQGIRAAELLVADSRFQECGGKSCCVLFSGRKLKVQDSEFSRCSGPNSALQFIVEAKNAVTFAEVIRTRFERNRKDITVVSAGFETLVDLSITNSSFTQYQTGSLSFESPLFSRALLSFCNFTEGQAGLEQGVIVTTHLAGVLLLEDVLFLHNDSESYLLQVQTPEILPLNVEIFTELRRVIVENSVFKAAVKLEGQYWPTQVRTSHCSFKRNTGIVVWSDVGLYADSDSLFERNRADGYPCYYQAQQSEASFRNTRFLGNSATTGSGGCLYLRGQTSSAVFHNCTFHNNSARLYGGAILIELSPAVRIAASSFYANAATRGSSLYLSQVRQVPARIQNTSFGGDSGSAVMELLYSSVRLESVTLRNCSHAVESMGSELSVERSSFTESSGEENCLLWAYEDSSIALTECEVKDSLCRKALMTVSSQSSLNLTHCTFQELTARSLVVLSDGALQASAWTVRQVTVSDSCLSAQSAQVAINGSMFAFIQGRVFDSQNSILFSIHNSSITAVELWDAGGFWQSKGGQAIFLGNVTVSSVRGSDVGASLQAMLISLIQCEFKDVRSQTSGLWLRANQLSISSSLFQNNTAASQSSKGGALDLSALSAVVRTCSFQSNSAHTGGAIYWSGSPPLLQDNTYVASQAFYGSAVASTVERLVILNVSQVVLASGQVFSQGLLVAVLDRSNQLVKSESGSNAWLQGEGLGGSLSVTALQGLLFFSNFSAVATPGQHRELKVLFNSTVHLSFKVYFRACIRGEVQLNNTCTICPKDSYLVNLNSSLCTICPSQGACPGDGNLYPKQGTWRPFDTFDGLFACPNKDACLGHSVRQSQVGVCAEWYTGNMCQSCQPGASRSGLDKCSKCPNETTNRVLICFAALVVCAVVAILTRSALRSAHNTAKQASTLLKIFLNYTHMTTLVMRFNVDWPYPLIVLSIFHEFSGNSGEQLLSVGCILPDPFFAKAIAAAFLPVLLLALNGLAWMLAWTVFRLFHRPLRIQEKLVCSTIVSLFYFHPFLTRTAFSAFECVTILPEERWLRIELDIRCWDHRHSFFALAVSLPTAVLWSLGIPALALLLLTKYRKRLREERVRVMVSFLCNNYKPRLYFWEIVIIYRKMSVAALSALVTSLSPSAGLLILVLLLTLSALLQLRHAPFKRPGLNKAEQLSTVVLLLTAYSGLYFNYGGLSTAAGLLVLSVIFLANFGLLLYLVKTSLSGLIRKIAYRLLGKVYLLSIKQKSTPMTKGRKDMYLLQLRNQSTTYSLTSI